MMTKTNPIKRMLQDLPTLTVFQTAIRAVDFDISEAAIHVLNQRVISDEEVLEARTYVLNLFDPKEQRADADHYLHIKMWLSDIVFSIEKKGEREKYNVLYAVVTNKLIELANEADLPTDEEIEANLTDEERERLDCGRQLLWQPAH